MRPKVVAAVLSVAACLLAALFWLTKGLEQAPEKSSTTSPSGETPSQAMALSPQLTPVEPRAALPVMTNALTPEQERAVIEAEIERLNQLSMKNDPASLPAILAALTDANREVREAAREATMQVADSNAIPVLKQASEMVDDPEEKIEFLEAMQFLSVPPLIFESQGASKTPEQIYAAKTRRALRQN